MNFSFHSRKRKDVIFVCNCAEIQLWIWVLHDKLKLKRINACTHVFRSLDVAG